MMELEQYTLGSLRRAVFDGDTKTGSLMAGQVAGICLLYTSYIPAPSGGRLLPEGAKIPEEKGAEADGQR